jgi:hypothetical protein
MISKILWTEDQLNFLKENYKSGITFCARKLGEKYHNVNTQLSRMGLKLTGENKGAILAIAKRQKLDDYKVKPEQFYNIKPPEVAYFLGYFWADGCVKTTRNYVQMEISPEDYESLKNTLNKIGKWNIYYPMGKNSVVIQTSNYDIKQFLLKHDYGIKSGASADKILSKIPDELKHYWWRGYLDGDGHIGKVNYYVGFTSGYDQDWLFVENLFKELKINKFNIRRLVLSVGRNSTISISRGEFVIKLLSYVYSNASCDNIGLPRKYKKFIEFINRKKGVAYINSL